MANIKITDLNAYSDPDSTDVLPIVDIGADETKKVSIADLMENAGAGTEALPGIAFDGDPNTGIYRPGADQIAISTAGTQRLLISDSGAVTIPGNLTVQGTTTFIDSQTLQVEDKNIEMGVVTTPTDSTADGGGITLKGATDKTINWVNATDAWTSSENVDLASGKTYKINGTDVLSATALGSAVQISSDNIPSGTIVNDDVNASAAIAGTKIDPDFGSQTVETTGVFSAAGGAQATPSITFTGDLNTGIYSPGADQVAISTGGTGRLFVSGSGNVGIGTATTNWSLLDGLIVQTGNGLAGVNIASASSTDNAYLAFGYGTAAADQFSAFVGRIGDDTLAFGTANTERLRIDSSGRLLAGTSSARGGWYNSTGTSVSPVIQTDGTSFNTSSIALAHNENAANEAARILLGKSRGTTAGSFTVVQNGDDLGAISFQGADGTDFIEGAHIKAFVDGAPGANDLPTRLVFSTNGGASSPTERMRIDSSGRVGVGTTSPVRYLDVQYSDSTAYSGTSQLTDTVRIFNTNSTTGSYSALELAATNANGAVNQWSIANISSGTNFQGDLAFHRRTSTAGWSEALRIDSSGRVGIGTSSPGTNLHIGSGSGEGLGVLLSRGATTNFFEAHDGTKTFIAGTDNTNAYVKVGTLSNHPVSIVQSNGTAIYIDTSKRVGIGTTSPTFPLQVETTATGTTAGSNGVMLVQSQASGRDAHIRFGDSVNSTARVGYLSNSLYAYVNGQERLRITSAGRVGIGTSSLNTKFDVAGSSQNYTTAPAITFTDTGSGQGDANRWIAGNIAVNNYGDFALAVAPDTTSTSFSPKIAVTEAGNVGINTTVPTRKLHVNSGSTDTAALFYSSDSGVYINFQDSTSAASGVNIGGVGDNLRFGSGGGGEFGRFDSSGRLMVGLTSTPSSASLATLTGGNSSTYAYMFVAGGSISNYKMLKAGGKFITRGTTERNIDLVQAVQCSGNMNILITVKFKLNSAVNSNNGEILCQADMHATSSGNWNYGTKTPQLTNHFGSGYGVGSLAWVGGDANTKILRYTTDANINYTNYMIEEIVITGYDNANTTLL